MLLHALMTTRSLWPSRVVCDSARLLSAAMSGSLSGGILGGLAVDTLRGVPLIALSACYKLAALSMAGAWLWADAALARDAPGPLAHVPPETVASALSLALFVIFGSITFTWSPVIGRVGAQLGGPKHAATAIGVYDVAGFVVRVPFGYAFGLLLEEDRLIWTALALWVGVLGVAHVAGITLICVEQAGQVSHAQRPRPPGAYHLV